MAYVFPGFQAHVLPVQAHCQVQEALNTTRSALRKWEVEVFVAGCPMFLARLDSAHTFMFALKLGSAKTVVDSEPISDAQASTEELLTQSC